ncbi:MAG: hypothetical protein IT167_03470 [Bryobacterales bacterium]|nr:hypothetical protein [Bryobacterales bacterium]
MSAWQHNGFAGDLLSVRVTVEAFLLEYLLDALAEAPFPINPEIHHHAEIEQDGRRLPAVHVDFPAWRHQVDQIRALLRGRPFQAGLQVSSMLQDIRA